MYALNGFEVFGVDNPGISSLPFNVCLTCDLFFSGDGSAHEPGLCS